MNANTALLRALKGAPISIVIALQMNPGRSMGATELAAQTAYSDKSISAALNTLEELGLAQNQDRYKGWTLTLNCTQLILPAATSNPLGPESENSRLEPENLRLSPVSSSSLDPDPDQDPTPTTDYTPAEPENLQPADTAEARGPGPDPHLLQALLDAGVYPHLAPNLAADPWITIERLEAWQYDIDRQLQSSNSNIKNPIGLLVSNLAHHREPPRRQPEWAKYVREE